MLFSSAIWSKVVWITGQCGWMNLADLTASSARYVVCCACWISGARRWISSRGGPWERTEPDSRRRSYRRGSAGKALCGGVAGARVDDHEGRICTVLGAGHGRGGQRVIGGFRRQCSVPCPADTLVTTPQ